VLTTTITHFNRKTMSRKGKALFDKVAGLHTLTDTLANLAVRSIHSYSTLDHVVCATITNNNNDNNNNIVIIIIIIKFQSLFIYVKI
jgi:hypothetical protein